jgi:hypothetical protein
LVEVDEQQPRPPLLLLQLPLRSATTTMVRLKDQAVEGKAAPKTLHLEAHQLRLATIASHIIIITIFSTTATLEEALSDH